MATNRKINSMAKHAFGRLLSQGEMALAIGVIGIFSVLNIPVPPFLLDLLITVNILATLLLLLVTLPQRAAWIYPPSPPYCCF